MHRISFVVLLVLIVIIERSTLIVGCHAGHTQTTSPPPTTTTNPDDDDDDEYEYDYSYGDYSSTNTTGTSRRRRKRQVEQLGDDYAILRQYFQDCLLDKVPQVSGWKSVVDFTILKTLWFFYSGTIECTEKTGKDDASCWKGCLDVYLRNTSAFIGPAKVCIAQYEADFKKNIFVYKKTPRAFDPPPPAQFDPYTECVQAQYNEADPNAVAQETGFSSVTPDTNLDIPNVVNFVRNHVLCVICDYSPLPNAQMRPDSKNHIVIGENELKDGGVVYTTTWPFGFEALIRKDARLRYAIGFCNNELEGTFRRDPPPVLGWTQWYTWGICDAVCGSPGTQRRQRVCLDSVKTHCPGNKMESRVCFNRDCAYWSQWGEYTPCISTCDLSEQYSFRFCVNGKFGDVGCQGVRRRSKSCAVSSCPVPWSPWTICSTTCGQGAQYRTGGDSVMRVRTESRGCKLMDCPQIWSQWSPWGPCSKTCGVAGFRERVRACESTVKCTGPTRQIGACASRLPPCQDVWSTWSSWSSCNYQMRTRNCPRKGKCIGEADEYKQCPAKPNPPTYGRGRVVYQWSPWSSWSVCNKTCGYGRRVRTRLCGGSSSIPSGCCVGKHVQYSRCGRPKTRLYYRCII